jgi:hypothetical protein
MTKRSRTGAVRARNEKRVRPSDTAASVQQAISLGRLGSGASIVKGGTQEGTFSWVKLVPSGVGGLGLYVIAQDRT